MNDVDPVAAQRAVDEAEKQWLAALERRRQAFLAAKEAGATNMLIAKEVGLAHQRVAKIIDGNAPVKKPRKKPEPPAPVYYGYVDL